MADLFGTGNRRDFIKKAAYVVPTIMSVNVALVSARAGSGEPMQMGAKGVAPSRGDPRRRPGWSAQPGRAREVVAFA